MDLDLDDERFESGVDRDVFGVPVGGTTVAVNGGTCSKKYLGITIEIIVFT